MATTHVTVVEPAQRWPKPNFKSLWKDRELAYFVSWRDIKIRYKQSLVGFGWAIFQPLVSMIVFTLVFDRIANVPSEEDVPYEVFVLSGLMAWTFFQNAVTWTSHTLVSNAALVTKVYFPRLLLPISGVLTWVFDLGIYFLLMLGTMLVFGVSFRPTLLLFPLLVVYVTLTALSVGLWLSALNVKFRDVGHVTPYFISIWLFLTPVIYPGTEIPSGIVRLVYSLNPMVGVVESFRWAMLGTPLQSSFLLPSILAMFLLLVSGLLFFLRTEQNFADVI
jgi:lipopolysaccharide transport system permease protein